MMFFFYKARIAAQLAALSFIFFIFGASDLAAQESIGISDEEFAIVDRHDSVNAREWIASGKPEMFNFRVSKVKQRIEYIRFLNYSGNPPKKYADAKEIQVALPEIFALWPASPGDYRLEFTNAFHSMYAFYLKECNIDTNSTTTVPAWTCGEKADIYLDIYDAMLADSISFDIDELPFMRDFGHYNKIKMEDCYSTCAYLYHMDFLGPKSFQKHAASIKKISLQLTDLSNNNIHSTNLPPSIVSAMKLARMESEDDFVRDFFSDMDEKKYFEYLSNRLHSICDTFFTFNGHIYYMLREIPFQGKIEFLETFSANACLTDKKIKELILPVKNTLQEQYEREMKTAENNELAKARQRAEAE